MKIVLIFFMAFSLYASDWKKRAPFEQRPLLFGFDIGAKRDCEKYDKTSTVWRLRLFASLREDGR